MKIQFDSKVVLVTGGSSGIGRAIVDAFLNCGADVCSVDRKPCLIESAAFMSHVGDLCDPKTCEESVKATIARFGRIDVLVNNAGTNDRVGLTASCEDFEASLRRNLLHYFCMTKYCREQLIESSGSIINISSKVAVTGQGGTSGYAASKAAVLGLTREWAAELAPYGVRVNAVLPAEVWTEMYEAWLSTIGDAAALKEDISRSIPLGHRFTQPSEIANTVLFLASELASHTTGQLLFVDGGYTHLDRRL